MLRVSYGIIQIEAIEYIEYTANIEYHLKKIYNPKTKKPNPHRQPHNKLVWFN